MPTRTTKVYPTPEHSQRDAKDRVSWWITYLQSLMAQMTPPEQESAWLVFTAGGPQVWADIEVSQQKIDQERAALLLTRIEEMIRKGGASTDELSELLDKAREIG